MVFSSLIAVTFTTFPSNYTKLNENRLLVFVNAILSFIFALKFDCIKKHDVFFNFCCFEG